MHSLHVDEHRPFLTLIDYCTEGVMEPQPMHGAFFFQIRLRNDFYSAFEIYVYNLSMVNSFTVHELDKKNSPIHIEN